MLRLHLLLKGKEKVVKRWTGKPASAAVLALGLFGLRTQLLAVVFLTLFGSVQQGWAAATTINFDVDSSNSPINAPSLFAITRRLTTLYSSLGVTFVGPGGNDGGAILDQAANFRIGARSGNNFLAFNDRASLLDGGVPRVPQTILFNPAVTSVSIFGGHGESHDFVLEAYDAGQQLVDSDSQSHIGGQYVELSVRAAAITEVVFFATSGVKEFVFDDLSFTRIPEPTTFALTALGLLGIGSRRRKHI